MTTSDDTRLPLAGIRVLDLSRLMAGNMLTLQLADFGAEVIKVESNQGDTLRDLTNDGKALWWKVYGRNKKSICLDLKNEGDRQKLLTLVPQAQVDLPDPELGGVAMHNVFPRFSRTPGRIRSTAPKLGQDQHLVEQPHPRPIKQETP